MNPYSAPDAEACWAALYALLVAQVGSGYQTISRHHVAPPELALEQQPALFVMQARNTYAARPAGLPGKKTLSGFVVIYFQAPPPLLDDVGQETVVASTLLNALMRGVEQALEPDNRLTGKLTLGGLVEHCWLEGDAEMDPGMYTQQGAAILPVKILVP